MSFIVGRIGRMFLSPKDLEGADVDDEEHPLGDTEVAAAAARAAAAVEGGSPNQRRGTCSTSFATAAAADAANPTAAPPRLPSRSALTSDTKDSMARTRSLSRVFNSLPAKLPSLMDMNHDMLEYMCHACLLEQDLKKRLAMKTEIDKAVALFNNLCDEDSEIAERGRLYTRLRLTGLAEDVMTLRLEDDEDDDEEQAGSTKAAAAASDKTETPKAHSSLKVTSSEWKDIHENWILVKTLMLRSDANLKVPYFVKIQDLQQQNTELKEGETAIDSKLEEHEMFREDCQQVETLLQVQQVLASMRQAVQQQLHQRRSSRRQRDINAEVLTKIIKDMEQEWLQSAFGDPEERLPPKVEYVIEPLRAAVPSPDADCRQAMKATLERYKALVLNEHEDYSHHHLLHSMHSLLVKWAESVLEIPTLFRLGYGGVTAPLTEPDNDDVSSWGDENAHERDAQMEQDEDLFCTQQPEEDVITKEVQRVRKAKFVAEKKPLLNRRTSSRENVPEQRRPKTKRSASPKQAPPQPRKEPPKAPAAAAAAAAAAAKKGRDENVQSDDDWSETQDPDEVKPAKKARADVPQVSSPPSLSRKRQAVAVSDFTNIEANVEIPSKRLRTRQKISFTQDEADAIREGVMRFGVGKWKIIKMSDSRLKHRTPVQIKDKFRNMLRAGEIEM